MIQFKYVRIEAFRSLRNVDYNVDEVEHMLLTGKNGIGKSSRFEAFLWCLYGETLHGSDPVPWDGTYAKVQVLFHTDKDAYIVTRQHTGKSLKLDVEKNGEMISGSNSIDSMAMLSKVLPPVQVFKSLVFCGQDIIGFLRQTSGDRRKIWSKLFGFDKWEGYKEKAHNKKMQFTHYVMGEENQIRNWQDDLVELHEDLALTKEQIESGPTIMGVDFSEDNARLKVLGFDGKITMEELKESKLSLAKQHAKLLDVQIERREEVIRTKTSLEHLNVAYKAVIRGKCEVCGSDIAPGKVKQCGHNVGTTEKQLETAKIKSDKVEREIQEVNQALRHVEQAIDILEIIERKQNEINQYNKLEKEKRKLLQNYLEGINTKIVKMNHRIKVTQAKVVKAQESEEICDFWHKAFSSRGLVSLQMDALADEFNKRIMEFVPLFFDDMLVSLVTQKPTKSGTTSEQFDLDVFWKDKIVDYADLSGGQRARLEVCIQLAFQALSSGEWACNVRVYDEVFDSLDDDGVIGVSDLIQKNAESSIYSFICTHNQSVTKLFPNQVEL